MRALLLEVAGVLVLLVVALVGLPGAVEGALEGAALRTGELSRTPGEVWEEARRAAQAFTGGVAALVLGRLILAWRIRRRRNGESAAIAVPLLLPGLVGALALGFLLQMGYGDPLRSVSRPGPEFAWGVLFAGIAGGLVQALPWDPVRVAARLRWGLVGVSVGVFVLLGLFGSGPGGTRINLGPVQPIEAVKVLLAAFLGIYLGQMAPKLRHQRRRARLLRLLRLPRWELLVPALLALLAICAALGLVGDLGPTLILGLLFLLLFFSATRSIGWVLLAVAVLAALVALLVVFPELPGSSTLALRIRMWTEPWLNGHPHGDQLVAARWAIAAGGLTGQGLGHGAIAALPAGHTDLVLAHLAEEMGLVGVLLYLACMAAVIGQGLWVAAHGRNGERSLFTCSLSLLLFCQLAVIAGGTLGVLPLTGVVVPFLSFGKSSTLVFCALVAILVRMAGDGRFVRMTGELREIRGAQATLGIALAVAVGAMAWGFGWQGVLRGPSASVRGVVTTLRDGTVVHRHDPRLVALAEAVPRGELRDREGRVLVGTDVSGERSWPLGRALGTLAGPPSDEVFRPAWSLERVHDTRLRGYPAFEDGPAAWMARFEDGEQMLFAVGSRTPVPKDEARARLLAARRGAPVESVRLLPLPAPDYRPLLPLLHTPWAERSAALKRVAADTDARAVTLTLDGPLQQQAAEILEQAAQRGKAAAAVVLEVSTGEVLVRAQYPDYHPGEDPWKERVREGDPEFVGVYGAWADKTGARGVYQAGSVFKLVSALAAVREGHTWQGRNCAVTGDVTYACTERDSKGPSFTLPHWHRPIHDHWRDENHGVIDMVQALSVSCNVFFAQLGLDLGPSAYERLVRDGLEVGWSSDFDAGEKGSRRLASTAFGQGAAALSVAQAARMVATVGGGGVYRRCPPHLAKDAPCEERLLVEDPDALRGVLAGMRRAVDEGTARRLPGLEGVRVYGKTGTADAVGLAEEAPWGIEVGSTHESPHSWFVALAEPGARDPCDPEARGRLAVAVVVPRGGAGAGAAGSAALGIIGAANDLGWFEEGE